MAWGEGGKRIFKRMDVCGIHSAAVTVVQETSETERDKRDRDRDRKRREGILIIIKTMSSTSSVT